METALECLPLPSLPQTESWVFITLSGLFFLLVIALRAYPSLVTEELPSLWRVKERSSLFSNPEGYDSRLRVLYIIFSFGTIGLYAYTSMFRPESGHFEFVRYLHFLALTLVFFLQKNIFMRLLSYTFFDERIRQLCFSSYYNIVSILGMVLFPLLVIRIYAIPPIAQIAQTASIITCLLAATAVILKLFQIFYSKLLDFLYILLYLCTLEILPLAALFLSYRKLV